MVYEKAFVLGKLLRMKAARIQRKHEKRMFGEVHEIAERMYGSDREEMFLVPETPSEGSEQPRSNRRKRIRR
jgi:hypothetical protein